MKLFYTITQGIEKEKKYLDMLKIAILSAKKNTKLNINVLYSGNEKDQICDFFRNNKVNIILCECQFKNELIDYYNINETNLAYYSLQRMLGCFMKFDIPIYCEDEIFIYADADTMFLKDYNWDELNTKTLMAGPEFAKTFDIINNNVFFSAGFMVINRNELLKRREKLKKMLVYKQKPYVEVWDQGFFNELYKDDFEKLPIEFNWKPYWGISKDVIVLHVHGPIKFGRNNLKALMWGRDIIYRFKEARNGWKYYCKYALDMYGIIDKKEVNQFCFLLNVTRLSPKNFLRNIRDIYKKTR